MYLYLPFVRRVREIVSSEQYERFLASDFTYFDLQFIRIHERFKLLGEEEVNDTTAYKLEETYPEASPYSKSIAWVDKETLRPLQRHYYDNKGDLWKIETVEDVTVINGVPTPMKITMKDVQNGTSTELKLSEVQYCGELADKLFEPENLPEVSSNPIWQPYCTLPSE
jgi:outer membrane lipoprotein-sorting protein